MANYLSPSLLQVVDDDELFYDVMNSNWSKINSFLSALGNLLDVNDTGKVDGSILRYNSTSEKFEPKTPSLPANTTTTTTTTSTTTTT